MMPLLGGQRLVLVRHLADDGTRHQSHDDQDERDEPASASVVYCLVTPNGGRVQGFICTQRCDGRLFC